MTNTFFQTKPHQKVSLRHPRSSHWHQLDLIITRHQSLNSVFITHSYHSADCDTDHTLVHSKIRLQPKKIHHSRKETLPCINTCCSRDLVKIGEFLDTLQHTLSQEDDHSRNAAELWGFISSITSDTAIKVFGKGKNANWVEAFWLEKEPVITAKRTALLKYKQCPSKQKLEDLRNARNTAQQTARCCANKYRLQLCTEIQNCSHTGNIRGMFEGIKKATGPTQSKQLLSSPKLVRLLSTQIKR